MSDRRDPEIEALRQEAEELRRKNRELGALLDALPVCVSHMDDSFVYRYNNRTCEEWFGLERGEVTDVPVKDVIGDVAFEASRTVLERALAGEPASLEMDAVYPRRGPRRVSARYVPARNVEAGLDGVFVIVEDVTERHAAQEDLRRSEERFHRVFEHAPVGIGVVDESSRPLALNAEMRRILGVEDPAGTCISDFTHPDDRAETARLFGALVRGEQDRYEVEKRYVRPDGEVLWGRTVVSAERDGGRFRYAIPIVLDVTEERRLAHDARRSDERFRAAAEASTDGFVLCDADGRITYWNRAAETLFGYTSGEAQGAPVTLLIPERYRAAHRSAFERAVLGKSEAGRGRTMEVMGLRKDGSEVPVEVSISHWAVDEEVTLSALIRDVTERKEREEALRASRARFAAFSENLPAIAVLKDRDGRYLFANRTFERAFGLDAGAWKGKTDADLFPQEIATRFSAWEHEAMETGATLRVEQRMEGASGEMSIWEGRIFPIGPAGGDHAQVGVIAFDVAETRRARRREELLSTVIEGAAELVIITDPAGTIEYVNPAFERITGYRADEVVGGNPRILKSGEQDDVFYRRMWAALASGASWSGTLVNRRKDGTPYSQESTITPVMGPSGELVNFVAHGRDVTDVLTLEDELRHAESLSVVGTLAAGIGHDFNNLLSVVLSNAQLLRASVGPEDPETRECLDDISSAAQRGAALVRDLLIFARKEPISPEMMDLGREVESLAELLGRVIPESIEMRVDADAGPHRIVADRKAVERVVMNLATNARDAMQGGGRLSFVVSRVDVHADDWATHPALTPGAYVRLTVADTGEGMNPEARARIFDPFFTTKEVGKGTGLGLATVRGTVEQSGGAVHVYSEPGRGTTFNLYFPEAPDELAAEQREPTRNGAIVGGSERVLVVEDDAALRRGARRALERLGYQVQVASDGVDGWEVFSRAEDSVDVIVTDHVMPRLGGAELLRRVAQRRAEVALVLASGYASPQGAAEAGALPPHAVFLQKPWTVQELAAAVREALALAAPR